jgi:peptide/nickel transport system substrate-binding protein
VSVPRTVRRLSIAALAVVVCVGLAACSGKSSSPKSSASSGSGASSAPQALTIATSFAVDDLDPIENGYWGNELGYSELLMKPQVGGTVTPWLLKSLTNTSPTTWVLTLNSGITFQDGNPLDAAALIACMQYQVGQNSSIPAALPGITLTATGADQVTLTTSAPVPDVPFILGDESFFIIYDQAAYLAAKGSPAKLIAAKLYTGPYVVTSNSPQTMTMTPNPTYWDGKPALSGVTIKFITDAQARILAVQHGEADIALYNPTTAAKTLKGRTDSYFDTGTPRGPTFQLMMNEHQAPFNDVNVRKAIQDSIDYAQIATQVFSGLYTQSTGMYAASAPYAVATQKTDTAAAGKLLDAAGYTLSGGTRSKDGKPLTFTLDTYAQQPDSGTLAIAVQAQLKALGIDANITQVPDIDAAIKNPTGWTAAIEGNGSTSFSGDPITPLIDDFTTKGADNQSGIADPTLDGLVTTLASTLDQNTTNSLLRQTQQRIGDNAYVIFLGQRLPAVVAGPAWKNYPVPAANLWVGATTAPKS